MEVTVAVNDDIKEISKLRVLQQIEDWGKSFIDMNNLEYRTECFLHKHLNKCLKFFIVKEDKKIVSILGLQILDLLPQCNDEGCIGVVCSAYTLPEYRKRGYISECLRTVIEYAKRNGITELHLESDNQEAVSVYKNFGFKMNDMEFMLSIEIEQKTFKEWKISKSIL